jgi:hypothetical protein
VPKVEIKQEGIKTLVFIDGQKLNRVTKVEFKVTPQEAPRFDFTIFGTETDMYFENADIGIISDLQLAASVVMEELRKQGDWYDTWVKMLTKCIEECNGQMTNEEIAKCYVDDYLLGSD